MTHTRWRALLATMLVVTVTQANAAWTALSTIEWVKVMDGGGTVIRLSSFTNADPSIPCGSSDFYLPPTAAGHRERLATLLAAKMSGATVKMSYYSCNSNGMLNLGSVLVN